MSMADNKLIFQMDKLVIPPLFLGMFSISGILLQCFFLAVHFSFPDPATAIVPFYLPVTTLFSSRRELTPSFTVTQKSLL